MATTRSWSDVIPTRSWKKKHFYPQKICVLCGKAWTPKNGNAAKKRDHCYDPRCEKLIKSYRARVSREKKVQKP